MPAGRNIQLIIKQEVTVLRVIGITSEDDEVGCIGLELAIGQPGFAGGARTSEVITPFCVRQRSGEQGSRFVIQSYRQVGEGRLAGFLYAVAVCIFPGQVADL